MTLIKFLITPLMNVQLILLALVPALAAKVDTVQIHSASMDKNIKVVVILPDSYFEGNQHFPVIYLLHGLSDDYAKWVNTVPSIKELSDQNQLILVSPDGDYGSWYLNSPVKKKSSYETFISKELITYTDNHYRTIAKRSGRAITGLSMGGHGALYNAIRNPHVYAAAGSMSGVFDLTDFQSTSSPTNDWLNNEIGKRLGSYEDNKNLWAQNSVINMIDQFKAANISMLIECGIDDFLIEKNREFHKKLLDAQVKHQYLESPGGHNWDYWSEAIKYQVLFLTKSFKR